MERGKVIELIGDPKKVIEEIASHRKDSVFIEKNYDTLMEMHGG